MAEINETERLRAGMNKARLDAHHLERKNERLHVLLFLSVVVSIALMTLLVLYGGCDAHYTG